MRLIAKASTSLLLAATLLLSMASPVLAVAEPDSVSLDDILIFEDLLETGDFLAIVPYNIPFTVQPDENINDLFIFRHMSTDGTEELGTALANPAYNGGYGSGVISFYYEASVNMTWDAAYIFRVQENPAYYPLAQYWDFTIGPSNYSDATDQADALKTKIVQSAIFLSTSFGENLLQKSEAGATVLSTYGELYYLSVIPGLQNMCPELFSVQLENPDYTKRSWSTAFADAMFNKYTGTIFEDFMTGYAGLWNVSTFAAANILCFLLFAVLIGIDVWKFKANMMSGFIDGYALLLCLMLLGFFSMIWAGVLAAASAVMGGVVLFLNKS